MRRRALGACVLVALAGCGGGDARPSRAQVTAAIREWHRSARAHDVARLCSRSFMAYDVPTQLWPQIGADFDITPFHRAPPPAAVERDCVGEFTFEGRFDPATAPAGTVLRVSRVRFGRRLEHTGGIARTATASARIRYRRGTHTWLVKLVQYRGRWRVLDHYD